MLKRTEQGFRGASLVLGMAVAPWVFVFFTGSLDARSCRPNLIPNGGVNRCANCHVNPRGGGRRTPFGQDVRDVVNGSSCAEFWEAELAALDSDGDGRTNGEELLDPLGRWERGEPQPGDDSRVTNPGVEDDPPPPLPTEFVRGDSNSSGAVDLSDGVFTLGFLFRSERAPSCLESADANGDGTLDISDAVFIFLYLFAGGNEPAAPFPGCGNSGNADREDCEEFGACG